MALAYIRTMARGQTDILLSELADQLIARGLYVGGVVQSNTTCTDNDLCDMDVRVMPDGPVFRISQSLGTGSRGCRLDSAALEQAVGHVAQSLNPTQGRLPQVLIVNKFGKHEADGRGFRPLIADAMMAGIPVLTAVNPTNQAQFQDFAQGMATCLPGQLPSLLDWVSEVCIQTGLTV
ncbi:DUF2478 domain-containing protein [Sedimentitalea todarodis]|uniref:DUF2478 domain-containing protein n=1 Tax=Sedimentitalea todarodis TaxID=1631240 RepID=A0ABU3VCM6_9RHOB|nr:DUF2478 domain-containing protein [Sedimentitalea todarodis]MDU9003931.1 DUF2478 domain-containing protein [Sedimentitalea todarodis]